MFRKGLARCPVDGTPLQELIDDPLVGSMFADRYVIEACIGEGFSGRVYRARHQRVSRKFAIKVLYGDHAGDPVMRDRLAREAEAASRLDHPNVVSVVDFGETEERLLYLVMDFVEGHELAAEIMSGGALEPERAERILRQLCAGLSHAHAKGLVHRDFKGENVLLAGDGDREVARIVDFGLAVMFDRADMQRLTTEGMVLGTPAFMSPEQATGDDIDLRSDLFSLGVALYEMLAGTLPFEGAPLAIARQNLGARPPAIADRVPGRVVPAHLEAIAMKLMAKRREDRFQSADEVLAALEQPQTPLEASERATTEITRSAATRKRRTRRRHAIAIAAAIAMLAAVAIAVGLGDSDADSAQTLTRTEQVRERDESVPQLDRDARVAANPEAAAGHAPPASAETAAQPAADAAPRRAEPTPGEPATTRPATRAGRATRPVAARSTPAGTANEVTTRTPADSPATATTKKNLQTRYIAVGEAIERLARRSGDEAARPYRARYLRIPFADALRTPSLRREVSDLLRELASQVSAELDAATR